MRLVVVRNKFVRLKNRVWFFFLKKKGYEIKFIEIPNTVKNYEIFGVEIKFRDMKMIISYDGGMEEVVFKLMVSYLTDPFYYSTNLKIYYNNKVFFFKAISISDIENFFDQTSKIGKQVIKVEFPIDEIGINAFETSGSFIPYLQTPYKPNNYYLKKVIKKYSKVLD